MERRISWNCYFQEEQINILRVLAIISVQGEPENGHVDIAEPIQSFVP
jgi:hypothetical protein